MKENSRNRLFSALAAYASCFAIQLITGITVRNPLTVVFFVLFFAQWRSLGKEKILPKPLSMTGLAGEGISLAVAGFISYAMYPKLQGYFDSRLFQLFGLAIVFIGTFFLILLIYFILIKRIKATNFSAVLKDEKSLEEKADEIKTADRTRQRITGKKLWLISFIVITLCYLPYFLYEFPGIMTADSLVQYEQVIGARPLFNHHPLIHTMLIKLFYEIGLLFTTDKVVAISVYTVFQMLFVAICGAAAFIRVDRLLGEKYPYAKWLSLAFYALIPFNAVFAVTIWKDPPFAALTVLFICLIMDREKWKNTDYLLFTVLGILFCLFRSNAWYAFIIFSIVFVIGSQKDRLKTALAAGIVIITVVLVKGPFFSALDIEGPDFTESLSVPLSQVAAVLVNDREVSSDDLALIDKVIDRTYIHELYAPDFADNIKELVRAGHPEVIENNKSEYFRLWWRLLLKYPDDYVKAWFDLVGGYIYPDVDYKVGNIDGIMGNELGLSSRPLIGGKVIVKTKEILIKLGSFLPLYGMFWSIGTYSWLLIICIFYMFFSKEKPYYMLLLLLLILTLLIAAPVVDFRYGYGIVFSAPVWIAHTISKRKNAGEDNANAD